MNTQDTLFDVEIDATVVINQEFESLSDSDMTMYQVAKILNKVLERVNVQKNGSLYQVRPQMIYNYNRNKMVVKGTIVEKVTKIQAYEFVTRFIQRVTK